ncbi:MAG: thioredoxin [Bacteroidetes bacterium]|nr:thioredoxin [Bacteroidota bacterium]
MIQKSLLFILASGIAFAACSQKTSSSEETQTPVSHVSTADFEKSLASTPKRIILDVRTPEEFAQNHLEGAINMNVNADDFYQQISRLDTAQPVFVYCLAGSRSARAADILAEKGFPAIYDMLGGMSRWSAENRAVVSPEGEAQKGMSKASFESMLQAGDSLVLVDVYAKWCAPCKKIMAYLPDLEKEYNGKLKVVKVNYDDNPKLIRELGLDNVPFLLVYRNKQQVWKHSGFAEKAAVLAALKSL